MKKLLPAIIIFFAVIHAGNASAEVIFDNPQPLDTSSANADFNNGTNRQNWAVEFIATVPFSSVSVFGSMHRATGVNVVNDNVTATIFSNNVDRPDIPIIGWNVAEFPEIDFLNNTGKYFDFLVSGSQLPAGTYWISFTDDTGIGNEYGFEFGVPAGDGLFKSVFSGSWSARAPTSYRSIVIETNPAPPITPTKIIIPPVGPYTETQQPFTVSGTCDSAIYSNLRIQIKHVLSGQILEFNTAECLSDVWVVDGGMGRTLFNSSYSVELYADNYVQTVLDSHAFFLNFVDNLILPPPDVTIDIGCDTGQVIADALCNVFTWLFIPDDISFSKFGDLWDRVKNKPPIGYVTAGLVSWNSVSQGTSSEVLEGTTALSDYFNPIKIVFGSLLWILLLVWIIRRIGSMRI